MTSRTTASAWAPSTTAPFAGERHGALQVDRDQPQPERQCGPRLAVFITRLQPFNADQLADLHYYLCSIPRPPNRYRKLGEDLTEAQRRGKAIFERTHKNGGAPIPVGTAA